MNSLAYAAIFNHENLVSRLIKHGANSHEGFILSMMWGNERIEEIFMNNLYKTQTDISSLNKKIGDLGRGNNAFHLLPAVDYTRTFLKREASNSHITRNLKERLKNENLARNLINKLKLKLNFTYRDIVSLLKAKNRDGKTAIEQIILSGNKYLYSSVFRTINDLFTSENMKSLDILDPDFQTAEEMLFSSIKTGFAKVAKEILIFLGEKDVTKATNLSFRALEKSIALYKNEMVSLISIFIYEIKLESTRSSLMSLLGKMGKENNNRLLLLLMDGIKSKGLLQHNALSWDSCNYDYYSKMKEAATDRVTLHYAARFGNEILIEQILDDLLNRTTSNKRRLKILNKEDKYGRTAFHFAVESGCLSILKKLLKAHKACVPNGYYEELYPLEKIDKKGNTPLHYADLYLLKEIKALIGEETFLKVCKIKNSSGRNALMQFVLNFDSKKEDINENEMLQLLKGYNYEDRDDHEKSIEMMMIERDTKSFSGLLNKVKERICKNQTDESGNNLLHYIAKYSNSRMILDIFYNNSQKPLLGGKLYLELYSQKNSDGLEPKYLAIEVENTKTLRLILEEYGKIVGNSKFKLELLSLISKANSTKKQRSMKLLTSIMEEVKKVEKARKKRLFKKSKKKGKRRFNPSTK